MQSTDVAHWRMQSLRLTGAPFETPQDVVRWLGAVQSQDYGPAKWSIGQRTVGVGDAALDQAFADGTILRTHVLRPTWHFVLPEDIRWMLELTAPRVHAMNAFYYRQAGLNDDLLRTCLSLLVDALRGGQQRTRKELAALLQRVGIEAAGQRLAYILMRAELDGVICSGAPRGKQHTYALLDERAPRARRLSRDEALAELTLRYFTSHGPATARDFRWWSSLTLAEIARGLEMVGTQLEKRVVDGLTYWYAEPPPSAVLASPAVHLLQGYDEYLVGYGESKYVLDASGVARALTGDRSVFNLVVILDGQVAGYWKRTITARAVAIQAALFAPLDDAQAHALQATADRYGEFLGLPASVASTTLQR
jgi:hypothetical protein